MTFSSTQLEKYADVLIWGLTTGRRNPLPRYGEVLVHYDLEALPLAEALHGSLVERRMNVVMRAMATPLMERNFFRHSDQSRENHIVRVKKNFTEIWSEACISTLLHPLTPSQGVDPKSLNDAAVTRKKMREILNAGGVREFGWTLCTYPLIARFQAASVCDSMPTGDKGMHVERKKPVSRWVEVFRSAGEIKKWLTR
jgi:aminopeptidase